METMRIRDNGLLKKEFIDPFLEIGNEESYRGKRKSLKLLIDRIGAKLTKTPSRKD